MSNNTVEVVYFFLLFGNGKVFASELYLEVEAVLSVSIGMTALMGSAGRSYVHSSALQAQHPSPWWTALAFPSLYSLPQL